MVYKLSADWGPDDGRRLKRYRKRLGLTQAEMGKRLGMQQYTVCRLENGKPPAAVVASALRIILNHSTV